MTTTQPKSYQPVVKTRSYENSLLFNQSTTNSENATGIKRIPAGATRVLPPPIAPRPKQSKVCM